MEIAALVSGGVDSSVVVHQLKEAGYDPTISISASAWKIKMDI